jgi:predicted nucleic acid-binding protein
MERRILDTNILSEYLKGHNAVVIGRAAQYAHEHGLFSFTSVTVYEIVYGLEVKGASAQLQRV